MTTARSGDPHAGELHAALSYLQQGELQRARGIFESILRVQPRHVDALHFLGLVAHRQGHNDEAKRLLSDAIAVNPRLPDLHNNLGEILRMLGDTERAADCYREAVRLAPGHALAHNNLGLALHQMGSSEQAEREFEESLRIAPEVAATNNNLGIVNEAMGKLENAMDCFRRAIDLDPRHGEAHNNLGTALHRNGQLDDAKRALEEAVTIDPGSARAWHNLARVSQAQGELDPAAEAVTRAIALVPGEQLFHLTRSSILRRAGDLDGSIEALRTALAQNPEDVEILNDLGVQLLVIGQLDEALTQFQRAIDRDPRFAVAYENFSMAKRFGPEDAEQVATLEALVAAPETSEDSSIHLHFALGKMLDDMASYERAFHHYKSANELKRRTLVCDMATVREFVARTCQLLDADFICERRHLGHSTQAPVFIVGMPRSGTSLVEQVLASHPRIYGAGEIDFFGRVGPGLAANLTNSSEYPDCLSALDRSTADAIARAYLLRVEDSMGDALRFTDKMPLNFEHLGLIALVFPNARIIHCRRDPLDICLSIYFQNFTNANEFAYDLGEIAAFYRQYERLMAHWMTALTGRIREVRYEDLVRGIESESRALLDYLELPWSDRCLRFHETRRPVASASRWQVRQPVYSHSMHRWKHYEAFLGELQSALAADD